MVGLIDVLFERQALTSWQRLDLLKRFGWFYLYTRLKGSFFRFPETRPEELENIEKVQQDQKLYTFYHKAQREYNPLSYEQRIVAFKSTEWSYKDHSKLQKIAKHSLESYEVEGLHHYIYQKPYICNLAEKLNWCLNSTLPQNCTN